MSQNAEGSGSYYPYDDRESYDSRTEAWARQTEADRYDQTSRHHDSSRTRPPSSYDRDSRDYQGYEGRATERHARDGHDFSYSQGDQTRISRWEHYDPSRRTSRSPRERPQVQEEQGSGFNGRRALLAGAITIGGILAMKKLDDDYNEGLKEIREAEEKAQRREARRQEREQQREAEAAEIARYEEEEAARKYRESEAKERRRRWYR